MADEIETVEGAEVETTPEAQEQETKKRPSGARRRLRVRQRARNFARIRAAREAEEAKATGKVKSPSDHPDVNKEEFGRVAEERNMRGKGNVLAVNLDGMNAAQREAFRAGLESRGMKPEIWSSGLPRGNADMAYDLLLKGDDIQHFRDIATINAAVSGSSARMDSNFLGDGKQTLRIDVASLDNADEVQAALGRMGVQFTVGGDTSGGSDIRIQGDQIDRVQNVDRYPFLAQGVLTPSTPEADKPRASGNVNTPDGAGKAGKVDDLAQAADELKNLKSTARGARLVTKGAKLGVAFGLAVAGGTALVITKQYEAQREYAQALCDAGQISQDVCDEYIKLNQELEALVQAENIGAVGPTFLLTTPLLEMEIQDRFEEFAQEHNLSQDQIDLLAMGDLEVQSLRTEFGEELRDSLENYSGSLAALNDLKTAMDARDAAQRRFEGSGHRTRYQRRHQPLTQDELAERIANAKDDLGKADDAYLAELTKVLRDGQAANALFTIIGSEMQGELLKKTAGLAGDDAPENIKELAALVDAYESALNGLRGRSNSNDRSNAKDVAEAAVDAKIQELINDGEGLAYLSTIYGGEVSDELDRGIVADATAETDPSAQQDDLAVDAEQDVQQDDQTAGVDQDASQDDQTADADQNTPQGGSGTRTQTRVSDFTTAKGNLDGPTAYIQTVIMFAQDGGYAALNDVIVSDIDNLYGKKTRASVNAIGLTGLPNNASQDDIEAQKGELSIEELKERPELAAAIVAGMQESLKGDHRMDVSRFLEQNNIRANNGLESALAEYAKQLGVEVPAIGPVALADLEAAQVAFDTFQEVVRLSQELVEQDKEQIEALREKLGGEAEESEELQKLLEKLEADQLQLQEDQDELDAAKAHLADLQERAGITPVAEPEPEIVPEPEPEPAADTPVIIEDDTSVEEDNKRGQGRSGRRIAPEPEAELEKAAPGTLWDGVVWEDLVVNLGDPERDYLQQSLRRAFASDPDASYAELEKKFFSGSDASYGEQQLFEFLKEKGERSRDDYMSGRKTIVMKQDEGLDQRRGDPATEDLAHMFNKGMISEEQARDGLLTFNKNGDMVLTRMLPDGHIKSFELDHDFVDKHQQQLAQVPMSNQTGCMQRIGRVFHALNQHKGWGQRLDDGFDPQKGIAVRMDNGAWMVFTPKGDPVTTTGAGVYKSTDLNGQIMSPNDPRLAAAQSQTPPQVQRYDEETQTDYGSDFRSMYNSAKSWKNIDEKLGDEYEALDRSELIQRQADLNRGMSSLN